MIMHGKALLKLQYITKVSTVDYLNVEKYNRTTKTVGNIVRIEKPFPTFLYLNWGV